MHSSPLRVSQNSQALTKSAVAAVYFLRLRAIALALRGAPLQQHPGIFAPPSSARRRGIILYPRSLTQNFQLRLLPDRDVGSGSVSSNAFAALLLLFRSTVTCFGRH